MLDNALQSTMTYLGPGEVLDVARDEVQIRLDDDSIVYARMAMPTPYRPAIGDLLLILGGESGHYVVGVLNGAGKTEFVMQGDVDIRAEGGTLTLQGGEGILLEGPEVTVPESIRIAALRPIDRMLELSQ